MAKDTAIENDLAGMLMGIMAEETLPHGSKTHGSIDAVSRTFRLREMLASLFSFEFVVIIYVYSGLYKDIPLISDLLPFDPTLFFGLGIAVWMPIIIMARKPCFGAMQVRAVYFLVALIAYSCLSLFWTPSIDYALQKISYLLFISMLAILAAIVIAGDPRRLRRFLLANISLSFIFLIALTSFVLSSEIARAAIMSSERFYIFDLQGTYQVLSRLLAFAIMSLVILLWYFRANSVAWLVLAPALLIEFFFILQMGGRGGLLGLVVAGAILGSYSFARVMREGFHLSLARFVLVGIIVAGCTLYISYLATTGNFPATLARLFESDSLPNKYTYGFRAYMFWHIPGLWNENPLFGGGLGSYPILMGLGDVRNYPHNMIAEILVELGITGLILYGSFLICAVRAWWMERHRLPGYLWLFSIAALAFGLAMASVGSDLTSNRFIWMTYGLIFVNGGMIAPKEQVKSG